MMKTDTIDKLSLDDVSGGGLSGINIFYMFEWYELLIIVIVLIIIFKYFGKYFRIDDN